MTCPHILRRNAARFVLALLLSIWGCSQLYAADYAAAGPYAVDSQDTEWTYTPQPPPILGLSASEARTLPVRIYYSTQTTATLPVIIFSHGLGGSRENYAYLARHWASHGYLCIHPTHPGSDTSLLRETKRPMQALRRAALDPRNAAYRPQDVSCLIDHLAQLNREAGPLQGRIAADAIGVAGHSFGAYTALAVAGQAFPGAKLKLADPRVKAIAPLSAPAEPAPAAVLERKYNAIRIPCLHMTGTEDDSPINDTSPADRRIPFDHMHGADNYLTTLSGGDHMVFSGRARRAEKSTDASHQAIIKAATLAFWDAYLRDDENAKAWLQQGPCAQSLGQMATLEMHEAQTGTPAH